MKKISVLSLVLALIITLSTSILAAGDLGPEVGDTEAWSGIYSSWAMEFAGGARKWIGESDFGEYAIGGSIGYSSNTSSYKIPVSDGNFGYSFQEKDYTESALGVYGDVTLDYTDILADYFDPAGIFSKMGVEARMSAGLGYVLDMSEDINPDVDDAYSQYYEAPSLTFSDGINLLITSETKYPVTDSLDVVIKSGTRGFGLFANMNF